MLILGLPLSSEGVRVGRTRHDGGVRVSSRTIPTILVSFSSLIFVWFQLHFNNRRQVSQEEVACRLREAESSSCGGGWRVEGGARREKGEGER